ncbi:unnamed protein product [Enterobius vermicularis]|uniref:Uncharacterized protein n=1 Tax=Enterobius vermicularis TaxID=51028 RepID=A0A0N4VGX8_ENTVE|nr:unnamed protein product [Enterobius vermicularis]
MSGRRKAAPIKVLELREDGVCESGLELSPCTSSDLFKEQQDGVESASFLRTGMIDKLNDDNSKDRDASPSTTEECEGGTNANDCVPPSSATSSVEFSCSMKSDASTVSDHASLFVSFFDVRHITQQDIFDASKSENE